MLSKDTLKNTINLFNIKCKLLKRNSNFEIIGWVFGPMHMKIRKWGYEYGKRS